MTRRKPTRTTPGAHPVGCICWKCLPFALRPCSRKGIVTHTQWTPCLTNGEPILNVFAEDDVPAEGDVPGSAYEVTVDWLDAVAAKARKVAP